MKRCRVVLLTTEGVERHVGGLGTYVKEVTRRLRSAGGLDIEVRELPFDARYLLSRRHDRDLGSQLRGADLVHTNDYFTSYAALLRAPRDRVVTAVHMLHQRFTYEGMEGGFGLAPGYLRFVETEALRRSRHLIAVSSFIKHELSALGLDLPPISLIHNGAGDHFFSYPLRGPSPTVRLGVCGRLIHQKGTDAVPALLQGLLEVPFDWSLDIVGAGPDAVPIQCAVEQLRVGDRVTLHGWTSNDRLPAIIGSWDAALSFTRYEPFGIASLESLALGTPIIGSIAGGMRDFCVPGRNSIEARGTDVPSVLLALYGYLSGSCRLDPPEVRNSVGRFTWDDSADKLIGTYSALLGRSAPPIAVPRTLGA